MEKRSKVCVTGASGFLGSWLVQKLLKKGHAVHVTLRNLGLSPTLTSPSFVLRFFFFPSEQSDVVNVWVLKFKTQKISRRHKDTRLHLFEAELYDPFTFEAAIQGCEFVFLLATPMQHNNSYPEVRWYIYSLLILGFHLFNFDVNKFLREARSSGWMRIISVMGLLASGTYPRSSLFVPPSSLVYIHPPCRSRIGWW